MQKNSEVDWDCFTGPGAMTETDKDPVKEKQTVVQV